jgi:flavorubredoxin
LILDERPALIHTGTFPMYEQVRAAIAKVMDPAKLAYVIVPHFEADECGGMYRFVQGSPNSTLLCSEAGHLLNFSAWDYTGPYKGKKDGERVELGKHTLRFLETPHVHHWDSMMVVEETTSSLFPADLFIQRGAAGDFEPEHGKCDVRAVSRRGNLRGGQAGAGCGGSGIGDEAQVDSSDARGVAADGGA